MATAAGLCEAVRRGDSEAARALLLQRPEIINLEWTGHGEIRALHLAVLRGDLAMVRLLTEAGADPHIGVWPNRDATTAMTLAKDRGDQAILAVLRTAKPPVAEEPHRFQMPRGPLLQAVMRGKLDELTALLAAGSNADEPTQIGEHEDSVTSSGGPLMACVKFGRIEMAKLLLAHGADPNAQVFTSGSPTFAAYESKNQPMIDLLVKHGGWIDAASVGYLKEVEIARGMLAGEIDPHLEFGDFSGKTAAEQILWSGASGRSPEIVRMALAHIDCAPDDPRWFWMLWRPLPGHDDLDATEQKLCWDTFRALLDRCDPNLRAPDQGQTMLHEVVARDHGVGTALARMLLESGARTDIRDTFLRSTPLGWACRWGRVEIVKLLLAHGADPVEADAEPWATPKAWAEKMGHRKIVRLLA